MTGTTAGERCFECSEPLDLGIYVVVKLLVCTTQGRTDGSQCGIGMAEKKPALEIPDTTGSKILIDGSGAVVRCL